MTKSKKLSWETFLFMLCWIVYAVSYIGRLNYSSVMASIIDEGILTFSRAGTLSMLYFFAYGTGQLLNGFLGDRVRPQFMIFIGLFVSGIANLLMGILSVFSMMAIFWTINGYAQSMIWPPLLRIFSEKYEGEKRTKYSVNIASSMAAGTLVAYFLSACVMKVASWRYAFYLAAGPAAMMSVCWLIGYHRVERLSGGRNVNAMELTKEKDRSRPKTGFRKLLMQGGLLIILPPVIIHGILKDGMTQWVPTYIKGNFDVSASFSVMVTMMLPMIGLAAAYIAGFVYRKSRNQVVKASLCFFFLSVCAFLCMAVFKSNPVLLTVLLFAMVTTSMNAVNVLYVNLYPMRYKNIGRVSTVSGFLNSAAYVGSAVSTFSIGVLVEHFGWSVTIWIWTTVAAIALVWAISVRRKID